MTLGDGAVQDQDSIVLEGAFQLCIFCDSVIYHKLTPLTLPVMLALTYTSIKTLTFLNHYRNLHNIHCHGLLVYCRPRSPLPARNLWQKR